INGTIPPLRGSIFLPTAANHPQMLPQIQVRGGMIETGSLRFIPYPTVYWSYFYYKNYRLIPKELLPSRHKSGWHSIKLPQIAYSQKRFKP
ncbi:MAG: hypothetical protein ACRC8Y_26605, partial [Chroococcales cyanobacterium]